MREKIHKEKLSNVTVLDGMCNWLPFEDNTFDIVMSGHVIGDDLDNELAELERITKSGGWILDCAGENDTFAIPDQDMISRGFDCIHYVGHAGGDNYQYRKQIMK